MGDSCIFLISKIPRDKRGHHKILSSFWKQKKDSAERVCREEGALPGTDARVYSPRDRGPFGETEFAWKSSRPNFIGVVPPAPASSPVLVRMYAVYKYRSVCICAYTHKAQGYISQDKLWLPGL